VPRLEADHTRVAATHERAAARHDQAADAFDGMGNAALANRARELARRDRDGAAVQLALAQLRRAWIERANARGLSDRCTDRRLT
jgi:hypothetical protein